MWCLISSLQDQPKDAEFQNVHLANYAQMYAIFASGVATERYVLTQNRANTLE